MTNGFTEKEIDTGLRELPAKIATATAEYNEVLQRLDEAKLNLKVEQAKALIAHSKDSLTAPEKQAIAIKETAGAEIAVIKADGLVRAKKLEVDRLKDYFTSIRKAAAILITEMENIGN